MAASETLASDDLRERWARDARDRRLLQSPA
jgi:hypothetical protein